MNRKKSTAERGNALFFVFIGIALFAALSYVVANMMRGGSPQSTTGEKARLQADEILDYGRVLRQGVQTALINGCDPLDISFEHILLTGYEHNPVASDKCKVFSTAGGGVIYAAPALDFLAALSPAPALQGQWYFPANLCIPDIGRGDADCATDEEDNEDLVAILPYIRKDVCEAVNRSLTGTSEILPGTGSEWTAVKFTGEMNETETLDQGGRMAGCFEGAGTPPSGTYHFFQVLKAR